MSKEITIRRYDRENGRVRVEGTSPFLGFDIKGEHYIIGEEDYLQSSSGARGNLVIPRTAYVLVSYDERTEIAKAREITDGSLLERIAIEFHMENQ